MRLILYCFAALVLVVLILWWTAPAVLQSGALRLVEHLVSHSVAGSVPVDEMFPQDLEKRLQSHSARVVVLDVREEDEFRQSHITTALHCPPNISSEEFVRRFGAVAQGKEVVWYCSVGKRSSDALLRLNTACKQAGIKHSYNLRGGIFRWHNEGRTVSNGQGTASTVHPYNNIWGILLRRN